MRQETIDIYTFDELSDRAKEKARAWYREGNLDYEWWDGVYSNVKDAAVYLGITIDTKEETSIGGYTKEGTWDAHKRRTRTIDCIYFSGFSSQGDGACFFGKWNASDMKTLKELQADFATDTTLHNIHSTLWDYKTRFPESYCLSSRSSSHYSHERSTNLEAVLAEDRDYNETECKPLEECLVSFMKWIYTKLEEEWEYLNEDEQVDESIRINEYEFTVDGKIA